MKEYTSMTEVLADANTLLEYTDVTVTFSNDMTVELSNGSIIRKVGITNPIYIGLYPATKHMLEDAIGIEDKSDLKLYITDRM